ESAGERPAFSDRETTSTALADVNPSVAGIKLNVSGSRRVIHFHGRSTPSLSETIPSLFSNFFTEFSSEHTAARLRSSGPREIEIQIAAVRHADGKGIAEP